MRRSVLATALLFGIAWGTLSAQAGAPPTLASLLGEFAATPLPDAVRYAAAHGIPLTGIDLAATPDPRIGDAALFLVELREGARTRQWLVELTAADRAAGDPAALPADTMHTSTGRVLLYTHAPAALAITFTGPFESDPVRSAPVAVRRGRAVVSAESLELGLVRYAEGSLDISRRLKAAGIENPVYYGGSRPVDSRALEGGRQAAAAFQLTAEEERLAFSVFFGLRSFFAAANEVPACREVLEAVLRKPSAWSVAKHLGVDSGFNYGWQQVQALPPGALGLPTAAYLLPVSLSLNDQPALHALLAVTSTQPPLRSCAGIAALVVRHPDDPGRRAILRLLAARPGSR